MDSIVVDVTDLGEAVPAPGGMLNLLGPEQGVDDLARDAGTIGYEVLTALGHRYHRTYLET
jgi:alanine racemase